jgi:hypothetical protein
MKPNSGYLAFSAWRLQSDGCDKLCGPYLSHPKLPLYRDLGRRLDAAGIKPVHFVRCILSQARLEPVSESELLHKNAWHGHEERSSALAARLRIGLVTQTNQLSAAAGTQRLYGANADIAMIEAAGNPFWAANLSPLYRYCVSEKIRLDRSVSSEARRAGSVSSDRWRELAMLEFVGADDLYSQLWKLIMPADISKQAWSWFNDVCLERFGHDRELRRVAPPVPSKTFKLKLAV